MSARKTRHALPLLKEIADRAVGVRQSTTYPGVAFAPASFGFLAAIQGADTADVEQQRELMRTFAREVLRSADGRAFGDVDTADAVMALPAEFLQRLFAEWLAHVNAVGMPDGDAPGS